ncbi:HAMP domain-containing sensor histidine kinase [Alteromonas sp. 5E99-2]|uniref:sensor histidine kinase n=1 Tax=Alteromonas sp. 5E99-2 TaxID=2817683 RepID=UPI001F61EA4E|nr:HAMP domain-containing sensor histidine kinase [Alteromonas sp. 5E99-2]
MKNNTPIDFSDVLTAVVHDMKNSLGLLIQSIETLEQHVPADLEDAHSHICCTHYEASRLNSNLVQLLSLYRTDVQQLPTTVDFYNIEDLLEDIVTSHHYYANQKNVSIETNVTSELHWYLDSELIYLLLNDVLINALKYAGKKLILTAKVEKNSNGEWLLITVEDDGTGYPDVMLTSSCDIPSSTSIKNGRTGLGLFFAKLIAHAHENNDRRGKISLSNGGRLGGSVFSVKLP